MDVSGLCNAGSPESSEARVSQTGSSSDTDSTGRRADALLLARNIGINIFYYSCFDASGTSFRIALILAISSGVQAFNRSLMPFIVPSTSYFAFFRTYALLSFCIDHMFA